MATYIALLNFTAAGEEAVAQSRQRADSFKKGAKKRGLAIKGIYWTLGQYDGVIVFEAPDDETATAAMLAVGSKGKVTTKTLRAFTDGEMEGILAKAFGG